MSQFTEKELVEFGNYLLSPERKSNLVHESNETTVTREDIQKFCEGRKAFGLSFGQAVDAVKAGNKIARDGWNGKGLFVFMQVPSEINKEIVPKMQSLPQSVKDEFERRFTDTESQVSAIYYDNQLAIVNSSNLINGWAPSVSDALANDWFVL